MTGLTSPSPAKGTTVGTVVDHRPPSSTASLKPSLSISNQGCNSEKQARNKEQSNRRAEVQVSCEVGTDDNTDNANKDYKTKDFDAEDDQDDPEMPKQRPQPVKREADISLVLNSAQRLDMVKLNEGIHAKLEEQVVKPFNYLHLPVAQTHRIKMWNYAPAVAIQTRDRPVVVNATSTSALANTTSTGTNGSGDPNKTGNEQVTAQEKAPAAASATSPPFIPKIDVDSVRPNVSSMSVLKEEAIQYFNKWKATFNKRFNDLIVPNQPNFNSGPSRQGQGAPRGGGAGAGAGPAGRIPQQGMFSGLVFADSCSPVRLSTLKEMTDDHDNHIYRSQRLETVRLTSSSEQRQCLSG